MYSALYRIIGGILIITYRAEYILPVWMEGVNSPNRNGNDNSVNNTETHTGSLDFQGIFRNFSVLRKEFISS
jgi:hypothetical protein